MIRSSLLALALVVAGCSSSSGALPGAAPLEAVDTLELESYLGTWYEISKYPVSFEEGLVGVTAEYSLRDDGKLRVLNSGFEGGFDGPKKKAEAVASMPHPDQPAKLKVSFFWPFSAKYWVIALDPDYGWAVVGEPKRRYLWVLSRTPTLPPETYDAVVERIGALGYDTGRLELMPQRAPSEAGSE